MGIRKIFIQMRIIRVMIFRKIKSHNNNIKIFKIKIKIKIKIKTRINNFNLSKVKYLFRTSFIYKAIKDILKEMVLIH
jgi:hypothetical protein